MLRQNPTPIALLDIHKLAEQILPTVNALLLIKGMQLKAGTLADAIGIAAL